MSLQPVTILGHLQQPTNKPIRGLKRTEIEDEHVWKKFFSTTFPLAERPDVLFSERRVIVLRGIGGWQDVIGMIKENQIDNENLEISILKISLKQYSFQETPTYYIYLFLSIDRTLKVTFQKGDSDSRLQKYLQLREDAENSIEKRFNSVDEVIRLKERALFSGLRKEVIHAKKALYLELSGPNLSKIQS